MNENIEKLYTKDEPFSFGGKYRLYEHFRKKNKVDKALAKSDTYTRFYQHKRARKYLSVILAE